MGYIEEQVLRNSMQDGRRKGIGKMGVGEVVEHWGSEARRGGA